MLTDPSLEFEADDPRRELGQCVRVRVRVSIFLFIEEQNMLSI